MSILLLGAKGQLGFELQRLLVSDIQDPMNPSRPLEGFGELHSLSRDELDLSDLNALNSTLKALKPGLILNASAYTAVDKAQTHASLANTVNHLVPAALASYAKATQAVLVHFSTDFVFDGLKSTPYLETDPTAPLSVYGQSKRDGEIAIQDSGCRHLIFRTGWLMGAHGQNFLKTMLRLAQNKTELKVVSDQFGAPTSAKWLAKVSIDALKLCLEKNTPVSSSNNSSSHSSSSDWGLYHASSEGVTSWHKYALQAIGFAQHIGFAQTLNPEHLLPIPSVEYPLPAKRPSYSVLNGEKLSQAFGIQRPDWVDAVHEVITEISQNKLPL
ncbi:MAG: dTDP-4-dehydrorhamnose reductase [Betaproteobacteria bacterium]